MISDDEETNPISENKTPENKANFNNEATFLSLKNQLRGFSSLIEDIESVLYEIIKDS